MDGKRKIFFTPFEAVHDKDAFGAVTVRTTTENYTRVEAPTTPDHLTSNHDR